MINKINKGLFEKSGLSYSVLIVVTIILVIIGVFAVNFFNHFMSLSLYEEKKDSLANIIEPSSKIINEAVYSEWKLLEYIGNNVTSEIEEGHELDEILENAGKEISGSDVFFLVDSSGKIYCSDGYNGKISNINYYTGGADDKLEYISMVPRLSNEKAFLILRERLEAPVTFIHKGRQVSVRYYGVIVDLEHLTSTVSEQFSGKINIMLYDSNGIMLYKKMGIGLIVNGYNIHSKFRTADLMFNEDAESIIDKIKNRNTVVSGIKVDDTEYFISSAPVDISDLSMLVVVEGDSVSAAANTMYISVIRAVLLVMAIFAAVIIGAILLFALLRKRKSNYERAIEENKKLDVIRALSENFDYVAHIETDSGYLKEYHVADSFEALLLRNGKKPENINELISFMGSIIFGDENEKEAHEYVETIRNTISEKGLIVRDFILITESGPHHYRIRVVNDDEGSTGIIIGVYDVEKEYLAIEKEKKGEELIDVLASKYSGVFCADLNNDVLEAYRGGSFFKDNDNNRMSYSEFAENFVEISVHEADRDRMRKLLDENELRRQLSDKSSVICEYRDIYEDTENGRYCEIQIHRIGNADEIREVAIGLLDRDELVRHDREREAALDKALNMAQAANRSKTTFLNSMSHDIRTPMNAIIGFCRRAQKKNEDVQIADYLSKINKSSEHLLSLINDVLDMSRIESGKLVLNEEVGCMRRMVSSACDIISLDAGDKNQRFTVENRLPDDEYSFFDSLKINQILLNVISNAIKYTPEGGSILIKADRTENTDKSLRHYTFVVSDNGKGMSEDFLRELFDPFTRENTATISGIQGTGLGMSITKNLVEMMGGSISVKSEPGKGSEFTLEFDFRSADGDITEASSDNSEDERILKELTVLLAEDNELNREIATDILEDTGIKVEAAENGQEAIDILLSRGSGYFDLILMDMQMPVMDGYRATELIRSLDDRKLADIPIIAMTANAFEEDRKAALKAGMNEYVSKPVDENKLYEAIRKTIK